MDVVDEAKDAIDSWHLGQTSTRYETGGRGAGTVSSGQSDHGGVSYGSYQFTTNTGGVLSIWINPGTAHSSMV